MNPFITCPTNCAQFVMPILPVNQECFGIEGLSLSQINGFIFLSKKDGTGATNTFPSAKTLTAFNAVIDNADITGAKAKRITVIGSMPAPERIEVTLPKNVIITKERRYTITGKVQQLPDTAFDFFRNMMCGGFQGYIWFYTADHIYGGITATTAIEIKVVDAEFDFGEGENTVLTGSLIVKWRSSTFPERYTNFGY